MGLFNVKVAEDMYPVSYKNLWVKGIAETKEIVKKYLPKIKEVFTYDQTWLTPAFISDLEELVNTPTEKLVDELFVTAHMPCFKGSEERKNLINSLKRELEEVGIRFEEGTVSYKFCFRSKPRKYVAEETIKNLLKGDRSVYLFEFDPTEYLTDDLDPNLTLVWESYDTRKWCLFNNNYYTFKKMSADSSMACIERGGSIEFNDLVKLMLPGTIWYHGHNRRTKIRNIALYLNRGKFIFRKIPK